MTYLAFAVGPEVGHHADDVVKTGIGALVDQKRNEGADGIDDQAGFDGSVQASTGKQAEGPLPSKAQDAHEEVDDLEGGYWLDGAVEVLG